MKQPSVSSITRSLFLVGLGMMTVRLSSKWIPGFIFYGTGSSW